MKGVCGAMPERDEIVKADRPDVLARPLAAAGILILLTCAAWGPGTAGTALLRHVPNPYVDPVLRNSILRGRGLLPRVFTERFLIYSGGEYRPLGYAALGALMRLVPRDAERAWKLVFLGLHLAGAILVLLAARALVDARAALGLAAAYLLCPVFLPAVNDVTAFYVPLAMLWCAAAMWLLALHARKGGAWRLGLSVACFAAALATFEHSLAAMAALFAVAVMGRERPRLAAALGAGVFACAAALSVAGARPWMSLAACAVAVLVACAATREWLALARGARTLVPFAAVWAAWAAATSGVRPSPLREYVLGELGRAGYLELARAGFPVRVLVLGSAAGLVALAATAAAVAMTLAGGRLRRWALAPLALMLACAVALGRSYSDDVSYWEAVASRDTRPAVELSLASALIEAGEHRRAMDILLHLKYEEKALQQSQEEVEDMLLLDGVFSKLGRAFDGLGDDRSAGYYYFRLMLNFDWYTRVRKNSLMEASAFCFRTGYMSCSEHWAACALVLDPYDARIWDAVGRALLYKNFFRASARHFERALELDPRDETALYHLAFVSHVLGRTDDERGYAERWRSASGSAGEIDYAPVYAAYRFDVPKLQSWFSPGPLDLVSRRSPYVLEGDGKEYAFQGVPLEAGRYLAARGRLEEALKYLRAAHETDPRSVEALRSLVECCRKLNMPGAVADCEKRLKELTDAQGR